MDPIEQTTTTLYPKIGKLRDFLYIWKQLRPEDRLVPIIGSVKLHGAHADWCISSDDAIRVQSRNVLELSSSNDIYGLAAFTEPLHDVIIRLRDCIVRRYLELHPEVPRDWKGPITISGEWCGQGIQKGVAISQLPRHFVIISIRIDSQWVSESDYSDIHSEAHGIFHIAKSGFYRMDLDLDDIDSGETTIQAMVADVEQVCPYGLTRSVTGRGEGIVWKAVDSVHLPDLWFKSKGDSHAVSHSSKLPVAATAHGKGERNDIFASAVVTEPRLKQGWDYLGEMSIERDRAATNKFVAWITGDVFVEEESEMKEKGISKGELKSAIKKIASTWYKTKLAERKPDNM
ncbi:MAG: hypothetical protein Q9220_006830 [cf. Caloplaca sp. 1 TL-2023]